MKTLILKKSTIALFFFSFSFGFFTTSYAQNKKTYSEQQASLLINLRDSVENAPDSLELNNKFIAAWGLGEQDTTIIVQYDRWLRRFPTSSAMPFAIGEALAKANGSARAAKFLLKAVALKPDLGRAWYLLSADALIKGDTTSSCEYLERAIKLEPANPEYAFFYAFQFRYSNPGFFRTLVLDMLKRFPKDEQWGATAVSFLIDDEKDEKQKLVYYELLKNTFIKNRGFWYYSVLEDYFIHTLIIDPNKSLEIAGLQHLDSNINLAKTMINVMGLLIEHKIGAADTLLEPVQLSGINTPENLLLFKAQVAAMDNRVQAAFDSLAYYYSKKPTTDTIKKALDYYGLKLGLTDVQIETKITRLRDSSAKHAILFSLAGYLPNQTINLKDSIGKVILLTYWSPGSYDCRAEFPYLEKILQNCGEKNMVCLGINTDRLQDDYVLPFVQHNNYKFTQLRGSYDHRESNVEQMSDSDLNSLTCYLIDQQGRIIFSQFTVNEYNEHAVEAAIKTLINTNHSLDQGNADLIDNYKMKTNNQSVSVNQ